MLHHTLVKSFGFRKGRGTGDQIANIRCIIEKAREFQKTTYFWFVDYAIAFDCVDGKFFRRWEYQTTLPASWEICRQVKKLQLEMDMEQWASSKLRKEYFKAVYYHPAYLTYMQSTSWEMLDWMKHNLESRFQKKYQQLQICRWHHPYGRKWRRAPWWKWKRRVKKLA